MDDSPLHRSAVALADVQRRLDEAGFFGDSSLDIDEDGWSAPTDVLRAMLAECRALLDEEVARTGGHVNGYGDAMLGYSLMESTGWTFSACDTWGPEARAVREEFIGLVVDYWDFICTHDAPGPMDLNKRSAGALDTIIGSDPTMLALARERSIGRHESIVDHLDRVEEYLHGRAAAALDIVPRAVLLGWRSVIARWLEEVDRDAEILPEVSDVVAAWSDTLRAALDDDPFENDPDDDLPAGELVLDQLDQLAEVARTVAATVGAVRVERLAVALARLAGALEAAARRERSTIFAAARITELVVELVMTNVHARRAVVHAGSGAGPAVSTEVLAAIEGGADMPAVEVAAEPSIGLFNGIDAEALSVAENTRDEVRAALARLLPHVTDTFLVELTIGEDLLVSYVQGLVEDDGLLHLEVAHHTLVDVAPRVDGTAELAALGWNPPTEDLPNPWRVVDRTAVAPSEIADLLVRAMDVAHDPFHDLPDDARLGISPAGLGGHALADETPIHELDLVGDGTYSLVTVPDNAASMHVPTELLALWAASLERFSGRDPDLTVAEETHEGCAALRATAHAARALLRACGSTLTPTFVATVARIDALHRRRTDALHRERPDRAVTEQWGPGGIDDVDP